MKSTPIYVTKPYLPPLSEYVTYLESIWQSRILTNCGPLHNEFEKALCTQLAVDNVTLVSNATTGLIIALKALNITGEVITTPYSFVATSHALLWNNVKPIFVDIDPITLNIDPLKIEASITQNTTAILAVHCYGTACDVSAIDKIAKKYNLKVIYDAAHAFGVTINGKSLLNYGDLSILSFHATKIFNTIEGGAIISPAATCKLLLDRLRNFGFADETSVVETGINGKMNELNAAMGLLQLKYFDSIVEMRKQIDLRYRQSLAAIPGIKSVFDSSFPNMNFSYFPIFVNEDHKLSRDEFYNKLKDDGIYSRRYFYPLISNFPMYQNFESAKQQNLPIATAITQKILCLPIYPDLSVREQERIIDTIKKIS
jgi:dTDP-4-amino-4,6-dideoxygalactose transaminase